MRTRTDPATGSLWRPTAASLVGLVVFAWIARRAVDRNGGYFSNNELGDWSVAFGAVAGGCVIVGSALVRRPVGRGILLGSVLAVVVVAAALLVEVLVGSA